MHLAVCAASRNYGSFMRPLLKKNNTELYEYVCVYIYICKLAEGISKDTTYMHTVLGALQE